MAEERLDEEILTTPKKVTLDESFFKGLAESLKKLETIMREPQKN